MENIKVSVILPVFNEANYIKATLDSIINQNFNGYEVIVIDDGSTDDTLNIVEKTFEGLSLPHQIIHQENAGVSSARNKGISLARGEYIVFVDGDDYILTNHLSQLYNEGYDFSLTQMVKKENDNLSNIHYYKFEEIDANDFIRLELEMKVPFNFVQLSYKTDIIKKHNLKFREDVTYGEDTDFAIKALSYGNSIKISNEITYYYIQHHDSLISTSKLKRFDYILVLEDLALFFKNQNRSDLAELIYTSRIPRAIFGNMNYFFYNDYDYGEVIKKMNELDLFKKLSKFKGDKKFTIKIKLFLLNPKLYYILWKKFKNSI
ncbi:glycosyltransferase family 2 protein [Methanobrevibacter millerae]|uniref:Glycosyl transferase GT2 family n=1 Tax=Methanobrevibacter millerae TaxID=230361 RepID=A0A0U2L7T6_9EURY|nr:glycosyltransferase family 2 protein [Methanobrevibacter millerae]ALT70014.1 glycosyl transferase GT2 family [Methanobrevibacter millerae]